MQLLNPVHIKELVHRFTLFMEKIFFPPKSSENLVRETSAASLKGGAEVPLPVTIDNCKDSVRKYHVTEASQSLRSKADEMIEISQEVETILKGLKDKLAGIQSQILRNHQIPSETDQDESSCDEEEERWARMGLLNVQSLNNKVDKVRELIVQNKLDVFLPTETWLDPSSADIVLRQASPGGFSFCHQSRGGRGQGVAIQYSTKFQGRKINIESMETFECVALDLRHDKWDAPILLVNVYRPPKQKREHFDKFLREFEKLLDDISNDKNVLLTGDFNIHVDKVYNKLRDEWEWLCLLIYKRRSPEKDFRFLLSKHGLYQRIRQPTHKRGHILDLVITRNVQISSLFVRNDDISDHYTVYFSARPDGKKKRCKKNKEQGPDDLWEVLYSVTFTN
ncbi:uncharacterized protein LOC115363205 [Myripristis murdjan]|uniref:uncharacterized protein LOC115363205 n=1 Tax=Myripristis murdjan TaxID=586833 RepID=UPI0011762C64|nr:uncharacterized protein LOC115363205 [Myripristis murdjan]XP_029913171.1 uncharacterized protein LOC115363205 [Myripristis murdjan]